MFLLLENLDRFKGKEKLINILIKFKQHLLSLLKNAKFFCLDDFLFSHSGVGYCCFYQILLVLHIYLKSIVATRFLLIVFLFCAFCNLIKG